jgi:hypothetical protein
MNSDGDKLYMTIIARARAQALASTVADLRYRLKNKRSHLQNGSPTPRIARRLLYTHSRSLLLDPSWTRWAPPSEGGGGGGDQRKAKRGRRTRGPVCEVAWRCRGRGDDAELVASKGRGGNKLDRGTRGRGRDDNGEEKVVISGEIGHPVNLGRRHVSR